MMITLFPVPYAFLFPYATYLLSRSHHFPLEWKNSEVVVCNTHLFYHPFAGIIRLLQLFAITRMVEELLRDLSSSGPDGYAELTVAGADEENVQYVLKEKRLRQSLLSRGAADAVDELSSTAQTEEVPVPLQRGVRGSEQYALDSCYRILDHVRDSRGCMYVCMHAC